MEVFSLRKISTNMNPAVLGTKKLGLERRKDLGQPIGIFTGEDGNVKMNGKFADKKNSNDMDDSISSSSITFARMLFSIFLPVKPIKYLLYSDLQGRSLQRHGARRSFDAHDGHVGDDDSW